MRIMHAWKHTCTKPACLINSFLCSNILRCICGFVLTYFIIRIKYRNVLKYDIFYINIVGSHPAIFWKLSYRYRLKYPYCIFLFLRRISARSTPSNNSFSCGLIYCCRYTPEFQSLKTHTLSITIYVPVHTDYIIRNFLLGPFYISRSGGLGGV